MKHMSKILASAGCLAIGLSGNAAAMMVGLDNEHGFKPDTSLEMCKRLDADKRDHFDSLFESMRAHKKEKFPEHVTIRWEEKWGDREDWSKFKRSHRPFIGFHIKEHFHDFDKGEFCPPSAPPAVVPVPAAVWLFGSGLIGLVAVTRRRSR